MSPPTRLALFGLAIVVAVAGAVALRAPSGLHDERVAPASEEPVAEPVRTAAPSTPASATSAPSTVDQVAHDQRAPAAAQQAFDPETAPEPVLMQHAAEALARTPAEALRLIEVADRRFGIEHEQRRVLEIDALVGLQRIGESHAKAERFYRYYPHSSEGARIERLTGSHPRPWGPNSR